MISLVRAMGGLKTDFSSYNWRTSVLNVLNVLNMPMDASMPSMVEVASWEKIFSMLGNEKINFPMLEKREKREKTRIYHMALTRP